MDRDRVLNELREIVTSAVAGTGAKVYLFGSWARRQERRSSDIDIAIEYNGPLAPSVLSDLRTRVAESNVPYNVDVIDLSSAGEVINDKVRKEGILWIG